MTAHIFGDEVNIESSPFYSIDTYTEPLINNHFAYVTNALDVNHLQISKTIKNFEAEKTKFFYQNVSKIKNTATNQVSHKFQKQYFFDKDIDLYFFLKNSSLFSSLSKLFSTPILSNHLWVRKTQNILGTFPHCDRFFFIQNDYFYTIWVALEDLEINNGVLCLVKPDMQNSNLQNYIEKVKTSFNAANPVNSWEDAKIDISPKNMSETWVANNMKKGDAVIFRSDVLHGSTNTVEGKRFSLDFRVTDANKNYDSAWFNS